MSNQRISLLSLNVIQLNTLSEKIKSKILKVGILIANGYQVPSHFVLQLIPIADNQAKSKKLIMLQSV